MTTPITAAVKAIADDLATVVQPESVWLYTDPPDLLPANLPMLAVWSEDSTYRRIDTAGGLEKTRIVTIRWAVEAPAGAETGGIGDPQAVQSLSDLGDQLVDHISTTYTGAAPIPGLDAELDTLVTSSRIAAAQGSTWSIEIDLNVIQLA